MVAEWSNALDSNNSCYLVSSEASVQIRPTSLLYFRDPDLGPYLFLFPLQLEGNGATLFFFIFPAVLWSHTPHALAKSGR